MMMGGGPPRKGHNRSNSDGAASTNTKIDAKAKNPTENPTEVAEMDHATLSRAKVGGRRRRPKRMSKFVIPEEASVLRASKSETATAPSETVKPERSPSGVGDDTGRGKDSPETRKLQQKVKTQEREIKNLKAQVEKARSVATKQTQHASDMRSLQQKVDAQERKIKNLKAKSDASGRAAAADSAKLNQQLKELQKQLDDSKTAVADAKRASDNEISAISASRAKVEALRSQLAKSEAAAAREKKARADAEAVLNRRIVDLQDQINTANTRAQTAEERAKRAEKIAKEADKIVKKTSEIAKKSETKAIARAKKAETKVKQLIMDATDAKNKLDELRSELEAACLARDEAVKEAQEAAKAVGANAADTSAELQKARREAGNAQKDAEKARSELKTAKDRIVDAEKAANARATELTKATSRAEALEAEIGKLRKKLTEAVTAGIEAKTNSEAAYEQLRQQYDTKLKGVESTAAERQESAFSEAKAKWAEQLKEAVRKAEAKARADLEASATGEQARQQREISKAEKAASARARDAEEGQRAAEAAVEEKDKIIEELARKMKQLESDSATALRKARDDCDETASRASELSQEISRKKKALEAARSQLDDARKTMALDRKKLTEAELKIQNMSEELTAIKQNNTTTTTDPESSSSGGQPGIPEKLASASKTAVPRTAATDTALSKLVRGKGANEPAMDASKAKSIQSVVSSIFSDDDSDDDDLFAKSNARNKTRQAAKQQTTNSANAAVNPTKQGTTELLVEIKTMPKSQSETPRSQHAPIKTQASPKPETAPSPRKAQPTEAKGESNSLFGSDDEDDDFDVFNASGKGKEDVAVAKFGNLFGEKAAEAGAKRKAALASLFGDDDDEDLFG